MSSSLNKQAALHLIEAPAVVDRTALHRGGKTTEAAGESAPSQTWLPTIEDYEALKTSFGADQHQTLPKMGDYGSNVEVVTVSVIVSRSVVVVVVVVVVCVPPEAVTARALPVADSISATTGGVTAAKRPAFSRNRRRSASFAVRFTGSSDMFVPPQPAVETT